MTPHDQAGFSRPLRIEPTARFFPQGFKATVTDLEVWAIALHGIYESFFWRGGELVELVSSSFYT